MGRTNMPVQVMKWSDGSYLEDQDMWCAHAVQLSARGRTLCNTLDNMAHPVFHVLMSPAGPLSHLLAQPIQATLAHFTRCMARQHRLSK